MFENMTPEAIAAWKALAQKWAVPLRINSAYRSPAHNEKVGGAKHSQHTHGKAFDVDVSNLSQEERTRLIQEARAAGFQGIGVYNNALHFDVGPQRAWGPSYSRDSLPDWAKPALGFDPSIPQANTQPSTALAYGPEVQPEETPQGIWGKILEGLADPETNEQVAGLFQPQQPQLPAWLPRPQGQPIQPVSRDVASPYLQFFQSLRT